MMMIKLFIVFSVHFLGTIYGTYIDHNWHFNIQTSVLVSKICSFLIIVGKRETPCECGILLIDVN
jgi:hypothetical protein